jgi:hypothetical protein
LILGFRRDINEICTLRGYYAASSGNPLPKEKIYHPGEGISHGNLGNGMENTVGYVPSRDKSVPVSANLFGLLELTN